MNRLGHASPAAALRYQHATVERDRTIAQLLGELHVPGANRDVDQMSPTPARGHVRRRNTNRDLTAITGETNESGRRESNPRSQLGKQSGGGFVIWRYAQSPVFASLFGTAWSAQFYQISSRCGTRVARRPCVGLSKR